MSDVFLELVVCIECKTRVEYHNDRDGYQSCECFIRTSKDEDMPPFWMEIQDLRINQCGVCKRDIPERSIFRCADCGLPFHQTCLDHHCKRGDQPQELRSENLFLRSRCARLDSEEMVEKVAKAMCHVTHYTPDGGPCAPCKRNARKAVRAMKEG